ncbi:transposase, Mutator family protein [Mycobacterium ulcerans str. Harvey]|uniref:Transposase, Mutator family protein n=1 Tax=Mycobacterium ulcerans str. Harvey TaxID=1299332 RepID=A0ABP3ARY6_MYCUL|nr:transposase, Mutator family protein [Mycobacterium ulcerans str. Harvey]
MLTDACGSLRSMSHGIGQAHSSRDRRKRQRRLTDVDEVVLSLYARGLTTGEISAHSPTSTTRRCPRTPLAGSPTAFSRR